MERIIIEESRKCPPFLKANLLRSILIYLIIFTIRFVKYFVSYVIYTYLRSGWSYEKDMKSLLAGNEYFYFKTGFSLNNLERRYGSKGGTTGGTWYWALVMVLRVGLFPYAVTVALIYYS